MIHDAVVFVPGMSGNVAQEATDIAARLAAALDRAAGTPSARFEVRDTRSVEYGPGRRADCVTIVRMDGNEASARIDVYALPVLQLIDPHAGKASVLRKAGRLLVVALISLLPLMSFLVRLLFGRVRSLGWRQVFHVAWGLGALTVLVAYLLLLLPTLAGAIVDTLGGWKSAGMQVPAWMERGGALLTGLAAIVTTIVLLTSKASRDLVESAAIDFSRIIVYFSGDEDAPAVTGSVPALLEHLANQGVLHRRLHLVGYSFGSVVLLDTVFPRGQGARPRMDGVDSLVTIGSPFDLVRAYWPAHYQQTGGVRHASSPRFLRPDAKAHDGVGPAQWINVLAPGDPISSNFRDDDLFDAPAAVGVPTASGEHKPTRNVRYEVGLGGDKLTVLGALALRGLKAHASFWHSGVVEAESCFEAVVQELYAGDDLLG